MRSLAARRWSRLLREQSLTLACVLLIGCGPTAAPTVDARPAPTPGNLGRLPYKPPTAAAADSPKPVQMDVRLIVLHVQIPRAARAAVVGVWDLVREDALDSGTIQRLGSNGVRMGVGQVGRWEAIRDILNAAEKSRVYELPPLRYTPGVPLALSLDGGPRDQTIFFLDEDGILSGGDWPASRKVLRLSYVLDAQKRQVVRLMVVPEVRTDLPPALNYTEEQGWDMGRRREGCAYGPAAFEVPVQSEEFILIGPGEKADVLGLVGGAFFTDFVDGERYDAYLFIRAEVSDDRPSR